ncbi:hypothetical protein [Slackia piriformis]|uniref:hypothetical protein n=1 Tax=Slackia piriformis TaxID=626934 RepID=UPI0026DD9525|nr:hypothetical protein [Slackia piriformis]MDO5024192.1 hypothetical protein [Slackia piriformis]
MMYYTLPDFTANLGLNLFFVRLMDERPSWFQDEVRIDSLYGCFPGCIMNGGRAFVRDPFSEEQIQRTFEIMGEYGLRARLTLTNMLVEQKHLEDPYFRLIMSRAHGHEVDAIVYSDIVDAYIRSCHPSMRRILSTTREILEVDELNAALRSYDMVVLNYTKHRDDDFLRRIDDPGRIEVMVNEFCHKGCPHRQEHYVRNSQDQLEGTIRPFACVQPPTTDFFDHTPNHPVMLTCEDVRAMHDRYGISHFKIVGRGTPFSTVLEAYVHYLVKPSFRDAVRQEVVAAAAIARR